MIIGDENTTFGRRTFVNRNSSLNLSNSTSGGRIEKKKKLLWKPVKILKNIGCREGKNQKWEQNDLMLNFGKSMSYERTFYFKYLEIRLYWNTHD